MSDTGTIQLVYASRSTFGDDFGVPATRRELLRIVRRSRSHNGANGIVGVLHFGRGCFLQVLEGSEAAVEALFEGIRADPRNTDVTLLRRRAIAECRFGDWRMKFLTLERELDDLLRRHGAARFEPHALTERMLSELIGLLAAGREAPLPAAD